VKHSGASENGNTTTANFVSAMMKTMPPLNDFFNLGDLNLPTCLKGYETKENFKPKMREQEKEKMI